MTLIKIDPKKTENIIKDRLGSMIYNAKKYGTSQDESEFLTYSNVSVYKGFTCMIARVPLPKKQPVIGDTSTFSGQEYRYKAIGKEIEPKIIGGDIVTFETLLSKDAQACGKELYHYIDLYRKTK